METTAAPVTAYLLGFAAGTQDANPEAVEELAARAQALAEGWDRPADAPDPDDIDDTRSPTTAWSTTADRRRVIVSEVVTTRDEVDRDRRDDSLG